MATYVHMYVYVCVYVRMYVCMYVCNYGWTDGYYMYANNVWMDVMYVSMCLRTYVCNNVTMWVFVCVCVCVCGECVGVRGCLSVCVKTRI